METKISITEDQGVIEVNQWDEHLTDVRSNHIRMVLDVTDQLIREKLIAMGWAPPKEKAPDQ
jgi:hypothetical protein